MTHSLSTTKKEKFSSQPKPSRGQAIANVSSSESSPSQLQAVTTLRSDKVIEKAIKTKILEPIDDSNLVNKPVESKPNVQKEIESPEEEKNLSPILLPFSQ